MAIHSCEPACIVMCSTLNENNIARVNGYGRFDALFVKFTHSVNQWQWVRATVAQQSAHWPIPLIVYMSTCRNNVCTLPILTLTANDHICSPFVCPSRLTLRLVRMSLASLIRINKYFNCNRCRCVTYDNLLPLIFKLYDFLHDSYSNYRLHKLISNRLIGKMTIIYFKRTNAIKWSSQRF